MANAPEFSGPVPKESLHKHEIDPALLSVVSVADYLSDERTPAEKANGRPATPTG